MYREEKLAAFEGIDTDILTGSKKNKQMVKMFLQGLTYKAIAVQYGLTAGRIGQILDRQARRANFYKKLLNDLEYQELVAIYKLKMARNEPIVIGYDVNDKTKHLMVVNEARRR